MNSWYFFTNMIMMFIGLIVLTNSEDVINKSAGKSLYWVGFIFVVSEIAKVYF